MTNPSEGTAQERLVAAVEKSIKEDGQEFEGKTWAIRPLQDWAEIAGVSEKTVRTVFGKPPFDTLRKRVEGCQAVLVRIGEPDPNQPSRLAATMARMFRDRTGKRVSPKEYGCLQGIAKSWPPGCQLLMFKAVLDDWSGFMAGVKLSVEVKKEVHGYTFKGKSMHLNFPNILTMLRHPGVAFSTWELALAEKGDKPANYFPEGWEPTWQEPFH